MKKDRGEQYGRRIWKWLSCTMRNTRKGNTASPWEWSLWRPGECGVHWVICASSPLFLTKCSLLWTCSLLFLEDPWRIQEDKAWLLDPKAWDRESVSGIYITRCPQICGSRGKGFVTPVKDRLWHHIWRCHIQPFQCPEESQEGTGISFRRVQRDSQFTFLFLESIRCQSCVTQSSCMLFYVMDFFTVKKSYRLVDVAYLITDTWAVFQYQIKLENSLSRMIYDSIDLESLNCNLLSAVLLTHVPRGGREFPFAFKRAKS
jgi:hypothetical protein